MSPFNGQYRPHGSSDAASGVDSHSRSFCSFPYTTLVLAASALLVGCLADDMDPPGSGNLGEPDPSRYTVGGEVSGLESGVLVLTLNEDETLEVSENGGFVFESELVDGSQYGVNVEEQPPETVCEVDNGDGQIDGRNVEDVVVACTGTLALTAFSDVMQMHIDWTGPNTVDLKYSSNPDCDWDNYATCEGSGMLTDVSGGATTLSAVEDEFDSGTGWYFVAERESLRSNVAGARPAAPQLMGIEAGNAAYTTLEHDGQLFVGGAFKGVGIDTGGAAALSLHTGGFHGPQPYVDGDVYKVIPDGQAGWLLAGDFEQVGDYPRDNLARIRPDGSVDPDWNPGTDGPLYALAIREDLVYVGGSFSEVMHGGTSANRAHLAALQLESGEWLDSDTWPAETDNDVLALHAGEELIYVGGRFDQIEDDQAVRDYRMLAAVDPANGTVSTDWVPNETVGGTVFALDADDDRIFAGGSFDSFSGSAANLATIHAENGNVATSWSAEPNDSVFTLTVSEDSLYAGGAFTSVDTADGVHDRDRMAAFTLEDGLLREDWAPGSDQGVSALAVVDDLVLVGGFFTDVYSGPSGDSDWQFRHRLAAFSRDDGALDDWSPYVDGAEIMDLAYQDGTILMGGFDTTGVSEYTQAGIAALDATTGTVDRGWQGSVDGDWGALFDFAVHGDRLYASGFFEYANGEDRHNLAAWNLSDGSLTDWDPGTDTDTRGGLAVVGDILYVAGGFSEIGGGSGPNPNHADRDRIASFDLANNGELTNWTPSVDATVQTMLVADDSVYVGGWFEEAGHQPGVYEENRLRLAKFDRGSGALDASWDPAARGGNRVNELALSDDGQYLYVGGVFSELGGGSVNDDDAEERAHIGRVEADGQGEVTGWDPGANSHVRTIKLDANRVYAGGRYSEIGGTGRRHIARLDDQQATVDPDWDPAPDGTVEDIQLHSGRMIVVGSFEAVGGGSGGDPDHLRRSGLMFLDPDTGELIW